MFQLLLAIIYLSFISLGLPDGLLGAAWPTMYHQLGVSVSAAGWVSLTIALGTIISSLFSDKLTYKFGAGKVTAVSVGMTCVALFGFSFSTQYWILILWAVPYGLGAGCVDAALNNYVALHYTSRHMSWLHCMWGIGCSVGPYIISYALTSGRGWESGYRYVGCIQILLTVVLFMSLPLWKNRPQIENGAGKGEQSAPVGLRKIIKISGVKAVLVTFFCYCALESTTGLWAASYLNLYRNVDATTAASLASMFYIGITIGRAVNGFETMKLSDTTLIRIGQGVIVCGILFVVLPFSSAFAIIGIIMIGLGCAPIYPCIIHSTPERFGKERSQAIVGVQMAAAYCGTLIMPPIFGIIGQNISMGLFPFYLLVIIVVMIVMHEKLNRYKN
jgi:fucose permease